MEPSESKDMTFLEHLEELRWRIIRSILAIIVVGTVAFIYQDFVFDELLMAPQSPDFVTNHVMCNFAQKHHASYLCINQKPLKLQSNTITQQFNLSIMVAMIAGLIVAFPYIFFEFWSFISPALHTNERKVARGSIFYISLLFFIGIAFGYFIICPMTISFFADYSLSSKGYVQFLPTIGSYISTITTTVLGCGITFELPILVYFLARIGVLSANFLKRYRRHAYVVILIIAAIITPPDVFSQIVVTIPLVLLYEVSIIVAKKVNKRREANNLQPE
jgi:sec-independent protein translocase protein TatC